MLREANMFKTKVKPSRVVSLIIIIISLCLATLVTVFAEGDVKAHLAEELDRFEAAVADKELYTSSTYAAWQSAYDNGIITNNTLGATDGELVSALNALVAAYQGLELRGDRTALAKRLSELDLIDLSVYTPDTVKNFEASRAAAKALNENIDATEKEINIALLNLENDLGKLWSIADFTALTSALAEVKAIDLNLYSTEGASAMKMAIEMAETVADNKNSPQSLIDAVTAKLRDARSKLVLHGNADKLRTVVEEIQALPMIYTKRSLEPLLIECELALIMLNGSSPPSEIDTMVATLTTLKEKLSVREDKEELYSLITEAEGIDASKYDDYKLDAFRDVIASAKNVLDELDPDESRVENAVSNLIAAREKLDERDLTKAREWWVWVILSALLIAGCAIDLVFDGRKNLSLRFIALLFLTFPLIYLALQEIVWWLLTAAIVLIIILFRLSAKHSSVPVALLGIFLSISLFLFAVSTETFWWCIYAVPIASLILLLTNRRRGGKFKTALFTLLSLIGLALTVLAVLYMLFPETFWWFIWWYY